MSNPPSSFTAHFLGTGTSTGVPLIGCSCPVCTSADARDQRLRASLWIQSKDGFSLLIDTSSDLRQQALRVAIPRVDAVLITHSHVDHIFGLDELRRFNTVQHERIPLYASPSTLRDLRRVFDYMVSPRAHAAGAYLPEIDFHALAETSTSIGPFEVTPIPVGHGDMPMWGYRIAMGAKALAYIPDCKAISEDARERIRDIDTVILDGLRLRPHSSHMTIPESAQVIQNLGARRGFITHIGHDLSHSEIVSILPPHIHPAYDGMEVMMTDDRATIHH